MSVAGWPSHEDDASDFETGDSVLVVSEHAVRPWRAVIYLPGPALLTGRHVLARDRSLVLPDEPGIGWTRDPIELPNLLMRKVWLRRVQ